MRTIVISIICPLTDKAILGTTVLGVFTLRKARE